MPQQSPPPEEEPSPSDSDELSPLIVLPEYKPVICLLDALAQTDHSDAEWLYFSDDLVLIACVCPFPSDFSMNKGQSQPVFATKLIPGSKIAYR